MDEGQVMEDSPPDRFFSDPQTERGRDFLARILSH
jgi:ABC-type polar amino acid transport system ATPase subunit